MSSGLNVLSLTAGSQLLEKRVDGSFNLHQLRQLEYAKHIDHYFIVTRTTVPQRLVVRELAPNLTVYPSNSSSRLSFSSDAGKIAAKICRSHRIDLVSTRDPFLFGRVGLKIKRDHNLPLNVHIMADMIDNPYFLRERLYNRLLNLWSRAVLANADAIRVSTSLEKEKIINLGYPEEKVFHIPFFVDFEKILKAGNSGRRIELLQDKYESIILTVARLEKQKDILLLVKAAAKTVQRNRRVVFVIIGSGSREKNIRRIISGLRMQDNVMLLGHVDYSILPEYFQAADVYAMTSKYEGTCMVLLEAAGSGLPIVSTATAGAADAIIEGETGYIVPVGDDEMFAQRLLELLDNPSKAKEMGRRGREFVLENFYKEKIVEDYISMWEYAASKKGK